MVAAAGRHGIPSARDAPTGPASDLILGAPGARDETGEMSDARATDGGSGGSFLRRHWQVVTTGVAVPVLLAAVALVPWPWLQDDPVPELRVDGVSVVAPERPGEAPPAVEVSVHNAGDTVSVIRAIEVEVLAYERLRICEAGGGVVPSASYDVLLPVRDPVGERVRVDERFEVVPQRADAFTLALAVPEAAVHDGTHVYRLRVRLEHSGGDEPVDAGVAVVPVPSLPDAFGVSGEGATYGGDVGRCYAETADAFARVLTWDGARPPGLDGAATG